MLFSLQTLANLRANRDLNLKLGCEHCPRVISNRFVSNEAATFLNVAQTNTWSTRRTLPTRSAAAVIGLEEPDRTI